MEDLQPSSLIKALGGSGGAGGGAENLHSQDGWRGGGRLVGRRVQDAHAHTHTHHKPSHTHHKPSRELGYPVAHFLTVIQLGIICVLFVTKFAC